MNRADFQRLSRLRVEEAKVLLDNGHYSGAYYILGYAVECALKACIAKRTRRYDFPDRNTVRDSYTHGLVNLHRVAGLREQLQRESQINPSLEANWAIVILWSEQSRYESDIRENAVRDFYSAVTMRGNGVLAWLRNWW